MSFIVEDHREWNHTRIDNYVIDDVELFEKGTDKLVYIVLCRFANFRTGEAWPTIKSIADRAGCSERMVRYSLKRLEEMELIRTEHQIGKPNRFILLPVPEPLKRQGSPGGPAHGAGGDAHHAGGPAQDAGGPAHGAPELYTRTKDKNKKDDDDIGNHPKTEKPQTKKPQIQDIDEPQQTPNPNRNLFDQYYLAFGKFPTPIQVEALHHWLDEGMELDLVILAIKKAAMAGATFGYAEKVLSNLSRENIRTMAAYKQNEERREAHGQARRSHGQAPQASGGSKNKPKHIDLSHIDINEIKRGRM